MIRFRFLGSSSKCNNYSFSTISTIVRRCSSSSSNTNNRLHEYLEPDFSLMQSIQKADAFAKPRLVNFLNRFHQPSATSPVTPVEGEEAGSGVKQMFQFFF